jgi:hypothetical protein
MGPGAPRPSQECRCGPVPVLPHGSPAGLFSWRAAYSRIYGRADKMGSMAVQAAEPIVDRKALQGVEAETARLLAELDRTDALVEPLAQMVQNLERHFLIILKDAARTALVHEQLVRTMVTNHSDIVERMGDAKLAKHIEMSEMLQLQLVALYSNTDIVHRKSSGLKIREMAAVVKGAFRNIHDLIEQSRWQAMERQADLDIVAGRVERFESMNAAIEQLEKLKGKPPAQ